MIIDLCGTWTLLKLDSRLEIPAKVPGSVIADLLDQGLIPDPYYRENEYEIRDLFNQPYQYSRTFTVPAGLLDQDRIELVCCGLDTLAQISINGHLIAKTDNMHVEWRFDIRKVLQPGENDIAILFDSPLDFMQKAWAADGEISYVAKGNIPGTSFLRKAHCMCGWDWGPQLPDAGIWRDIYVQGSRVARLEDIRISQQHEQGSVKIQGEFEIEVFSNDDLEVLAELTAPDGETRLAVVDCSGQAGTFSFDIANPQLWWPRGYGEQPLYRISVALRCNNAVIDRRDLRLGLRTLQISREKDAWGEEFCFKANGFKIFSMGADYIPEDSIFRRVTPDRTRRLLEDCAAANYNTIRVWGGGYYPDSWFFDICDELGLIVWLDLMYACNVYRMTDAFEKSIVLETEQNLRRLRHHASLGLICANNEMEWAWCEWPTVKNHNAVLRADYLKQFEFVLQRACRRFAPEVEFWPSSPSSGGSFDYPNDPNRGDVHFWEVWHGMKPFTEYRKHYFRYCSEFGFESFPSLKTIRSFAEPQDMNIFSRVMESHQKNGAANGKILWYMAENYRYPTSFPALLYSSQLLQADAVRYGVEHWRQNRGRCMGSIYWQINDCWPVASWSSIDYFGRWKALHYYAKRFYAPVLISAAEQGTCVALHVTNETMAGFQGQVVWYLRDHQGKVVRQGSAPVTVAPLTALQAIELDFAGDLAAAETTQHPEDRLVLDYRLFNGVTPLTGEAPVSAGSLLFTQPKYFEFLNPRIQADVMEDENGVRLELTAQHYAKAVCLELSDADVLFDDNWFDLYPDEVKTVRVLQDQTDCRLDAAAIRQQLTLMSIFDIER